MIEFLMSSLLALLLIGFPLAIWHHEIQCERYYRRVSDEMRKRHARDTDAL